MFFPIDDYLPYFPHIFQKPSTAAKRLNLVQYRLCHQLGGGGGMVADLAKHLPPAYQVRGSIPSPI